MNDDVDRNDAVFWLPLLAECGVPHPPAELVTTNVELLDLLDGKTPEGFPEFLARLETAVRKAGVPCFLRTGHTSGKHRWRETCYLERVEDLGQHVVNLVECSALADIMGLPTGNWFVRPLLPLLAGFLAFDGMPVAVEQRWFIRDGAILCRHFYWPEAAIENPSTPHWRPLLWDLEDIARQERPKAQAIVQRVAAGFDGAWSVDLAMTEDHQWHVIDLAEMERSYHDPRCPHAKTD